MMTENNKNSSVGNLIAICVFIAIALAYFWSDISKSNIFMRTFKHDAWVQKKAKTEAFRAKLEILDKRECKLLMKARLEAISIDIDRYVLFGMDKSSAEEFSNMSIKEDQKMCDEFGISPYIKQEPIKSTETCYDRQGAYEC
jgi:hypothetical protein